MKHLWYFFLIFTILFTSSTTRARMNDSTMVLPDLINWVLENNLELQAIYHNWKIVESRISREGALPDPILKIGVMNLPVDSWVFNREPMTGKQIGLMQAIPFPGKLPLRRKIAREDARMAELEYIEFRNQLIFQIKQIYYELFYLDKAIKTKKENATLLKQLSGIAETQYRVGQGLQQDALKAQLEYSKISDDLIELQQKRRNLEVQLNFLLNQPSDQVWGKTVEPSFIDFSMDLKVLQKSAEKNRPLLQSYAILQRQSTEKVKLAKKGYLPDFSAEVTFTQREGLINGMEGVNFFSGMVSLNLPVFFWQKQKQEVQEKKMRGIAVQHYYQNIIHKVKSDLEQNLSELYSNKHRSELFKSVIIPQASLALQSALSAYRVDKVDFQTVVDNQLTLFKYELEYFRVYSDYLLNIANLEFLTGRELMDLN